MNFFSPAETAGNYLAAGRAKVSMPPAKMLLLAVFAGVFIGIGGVGATAAAVSVAQPSLGKVLGACIFPGGLTMVILTGSELFTGNNLLVIPLAQREIRLAGMLKNWVIVYAGNFIGGLLVAAGIVFSHQTDLFGNGMAVSVISTASAKCSLSFGDAFVRAVFCNFLVCIAVWIAMSAKDVAGKIIGLFFPIMIFVLCGFEHSVANMYFISAGLFAKMNAVYAQAAADAGIEMSALTWGNFLGKNLLPVTLGNLVGGAVCVGLMFWTVFLKKKK